MLLPTESFQAVQTAFMTFPSEFRIDYVRVYQRKGLSEDYRSCDPKSNAAACTGNLDIFSHSKFHRSSDGRLYQQVRHINLFFFLFKAPNTDVRFHETSECVHKFVMNHSYHAYVSNHLSLL